MTYLFWFFYLSLPDAWIKKPASLEYGCAL